jgi:hypothetical protein
MSDLTNWYNAKAADAVSAYCRRWWRFAYWEVIYTDHVAKSLYCRLPWRRNIGISLRRDTGISVGKNL